jgi:hypothetical protein
MKPKSTVQHKAEAPAALESGSPHSPTLSLPWDAERFLEQWQTPATQTSYRMALLALQRFAEETHLTESHKPLRPEQLSLDFLKHYYVWLSRPHAARPSPAAAAAVAADAQPARSAKGEPRAKGAGTAAPRSTA